MDRERHAAKVALVTGAGSGIGRATLLRLVAEGATAIGCDINAATLDESATLVRAAGGACQTAVANLADHDAVEGLVAGIITQHGRLDILTNNAGVLDGFLAPHEVSDNEWHRVLNINLTAPMMLCRAVLPAMRAARSGAIVNVASIGGMGGGSAGLAYTVSKHGLIGLTKNVAWMYRAEGIRCNAVCPGGVQTNIGASSATLSDFGRERCEAFFGTMVAMAEPDQIATMISWLACDEASNVNGAIVTDDGGWRAA